MFKKDGKGKKKTAGKKGKIIPQVKLLQKKGEKELTPELQLSVNKTESWLRRFFKKKSKAKVKIGATQAKDVGKRQRIFFLAFIIVVFIFGLKVWGREEWLVSEALIAAVAAGVITYLGLMWAFRFDLAPSSFSTVLLQAAIFSFSMVLFLELFFFQHFVRIYESIIFGSILVILWLILGGAFLSANILNVAKIKPIPLLKVAQTASYGITLFIVYFLTFSLISSNLPVYILIPVLGLAYFVVVMAHLSYFPLNSKYLYLFSISIAWVAMVSLACLIIWPMSALFICIMPTLAVYIGLGLVMLNVGKSLDTRAYWEYSLIALLVIVVLLINATWGFAGLVWQ